MSYKKILVPLDGSELAETALDHLPALASPGAEVHLLSIIGSIEVEPLTETRAPMTTVMNAMYGLTPVQESDYERISDPVTYQARTEYLRVVSDRLREKGYTVISHLELDDVADSIVNTAKDDFDLILMATHGRTGFRRFVLGSVADAVVRSAPCPVLLVRGPAVLG